jgi:hypothetical protein
MFRKLAKTGMLLVPVVLLVAGCIEEDSITITTDGRVKFESTVTVQDDDKNLEFAQIDRFVSDVVSELQQGKWTVEQKWLSRERPYRFLLTGSGDLHEVAEQTKFYTLTPLATGFYRVTFTTPEAAGLLNLRRIVFPADAPEKAAKIHNSHGERLTQIDNAAPQFICTIVLR